jgi:molybdate transport system substrate-binding protein
MLKMFNLGIIFSSFLSLGMIIGCSNNKGAPSNTSFDPLQPIYQAAQISSEKDELIISAAASLTNSLQELKLLYEGKHPNIYLTFNIGASGALRQQLEQGAPVDLFISADTSNMKTLVDKQIIDANQQSVILLNKLVVVVPTDSKPWINKLDDLKKAEVKNIAIGDPQTVPTGNYTKDVLTNAELWYSLQSKMVFGKSVRQVLTYVESGNADAGFVYLTDALTSKKVKVALSIDHKGYNPIQYPVGIVKATPHLAQAQDFYNFLKSTEAKEIFIKYGFIVST